jgi:hypothetical protein
MMREIIVDTMSQALATAGTSYLPYEDHREGVVRTLADAETLRTKDLYIPEDELHPMHELPKRLLQVRRQIHAISRRVVSSAFHEVDRRSGYNDYYSRLLQARAVSHQPMIVQHFAEEAWPDHYANRFTQMYAERLLLEDGLSDNMQTWLTRGVNTGDIMKTVQESGGIL